MRQMHLIELVPVEQPLKPWLNLFPIKYNLDMEEVFPIRLNEATGKWALNPDYYNDDIAVLRDEFLLD